MHTLII